MPPTLDPITPIDQLATAALRLWDLPHGVTATRINVSENITYLIEAPGHKSVLRIHREGYHSHRAIGCELAWSQALRAGHTVSTPAVIPGKNGAAIQRATHPALSISRHMVMFTFAEGHQPDESTDLVPAFTELGEIAAATHLHSIQWPRPEPFERLHWNLDTVFGPAPTWGNWRDAPNVTPAVVTVLEQVQATVSARLTAYGMTPDRYGLIHADMRLANLLIDGDTTHLIDFDDCGFGWFLYDFAAAISFIEDHPQIPALKAAWLAGYRRIRPLSAADEAQIDTFIMLRRLALLAWIGTHIDAPEPQALAPDFARVSAVLGTAYLAAYT